MERGGAGGYRGRASGRIGGGGGGRGPSRVPIPERLQISEQLGPTSSCTPDMKDKILPVQRPDKGSKLAIQTCWLRANHFPVKFNPMSIIMHYNVEVKPKLPPKHGSPQITSKSVLSTVRERLLSDDPKRLPLGKIAYDGEKNIFSAVPLPEETFTVNISKGEDEGSSSYDVTLTLVNKLELRKLKEYLSGEVFSIPRDIGRGNKLHYAPMEYLDRDAAKTLKAMSLARPKERKSVIQKMVQSRDGPCGGGIMQSFGMNVNTNMTTVEGRNIGPPKLKLGDPNGKIMSITLDPEKCQWNLLGKSMVECKPVERWAILDFTSFGPYRLQLKGDEFVQKLIVKYRKLGVDMKEPVWYEHSSMMQLANYDSLCQLLEKINDRGYKKGHGRLQFILCVMTSKDPGYKTLKWISETKVAIVTQCCLSGNANEGKDQYLTNLALKINAKLGDSNVELNNRLPHFEDEGHVMFIGADVNHPAAGDCDTNSPSIAAVVATVNWPAANRYAARVCHQYHRKEKILNFGEVCLELVGCYDRLNKVRPGKIVIFRDGVSEDQFDMVLNEELQDLKRAFQCSNYFPTITLIVAQKRHQTRLFLDGAHNGNVLPGTVVDTNIIHPFEFDFYLCSHYGSLGTSKPTHYHVLWDEHGFTSDDLQKLIYDMCFTFARCTKPVSLVPPVYYADLAAYRGRLYHEARIGVQSPDSASSSSSSLTSLSLSTTASIEQGFYRLHADLENVMFFI